jgi:hypothetical protein
MSNNQNVVYMPPKTSDGNHICMVKLPMVRLSYPHLFTPTQFDENAKMMYQSTFLVRKGSDADKYLKNALEILFGKTKAWGKIPDDKVCVRDGSERDADGYGPDVVFFNAKSEKRPMVVNRDLSPLTESDNVIYAGCYVTASINLTAMKNKYGKRIAAYIRGVMFVKDGEHFGATSVDPAKEFSSFSEDNSDLGDIF